MGFISSIYFKFYKFIAKERLRASDIEPRRIHAFILCVLSTGVLMWSYYICAYLTISSPIPWIVGLTCSIIHITSPLLFRVTGNLLFCTLLMLTSGFIHQGTFAFYTGGFNSHILIWYGIIPMLAGVIEGLKATVITSIAVTFIATSFLILELSGFTFPNLITPGGRLFAHSCLVFGWIGVATVIMFSYEKMLRKNEMIINEEKEKTENLLRILLHDISNSATIISNSNKLLKKVSLNSDPIQRIHSKILTHSNVLIDTIVSVKNMHVLEKGKKELNLTQVPLKESLLYVLNYLETNMKEKNIDVKFDDQVGTLTLDIDKTIFEHQVLINILSNCIKFSPPNQSIEIWISENVQDPQSINLHIRDHGIGIPEEILENIFNPKYKTSRRGTNNEKGTGLGMIIMKAMIEKMNGLVTIKSQTEGNNKGTEYILNIKSSDRQRQAS